MSDSIFTAQQAHPPSRHDPRGRPRSPRAALAPATSAAPAPIAANRPERPQSARAPSPGRASPAVRPTAALLLASPATLRTPTTVASSNDATLVGILDTPLFPGETAREGFHRKEADLRAAFAELPVASQRALYARLSNPRIGDQLAERFSRLTADRRTRLLTFLADARRREALAQAKNTDR